MSRLSSVLPPRLTLFRPVSPLSPRDRSGRSSHVSARTTQLAFTQQEAVTAEKVQKLSCATMELKVAE